MLYLRVFKRLLIIKCYFRNGITENELDDLLSLDDEVLDNSYQHWSPSSEKIVRIPTLLWSRLRHGIGEDLVERQANGYRVLSLYHRSVDFMFLNKFSNFWFEYIFDRKACLKKDFLNITGLSVFISAAVCIHKFIYHASHLV